MKECFICDRKTNKGSYVRMDKREQGDGLFGDAFICNKCMEEDG